jgi:hypothetical protein
MERTLSIDYRLLLSGELDMKLEEATRHTSPAQQAGLL